MGHWEPSRPGSMGGLHCPAPGPWASHLIGLCRHEDLHPHCDGGVSESMTMSAKCPAHAWGMGGSPRVPASPPSAARGPLPSSPSAPSAGGTRPASSAVLVISVNHLPGTVVILLTLHSPSPAPKGVPRLPRRIPATGPGTEALTSPPSSKQTTCSKAQVASHPTPPQVFTHFTLSIYSLKFCSVLVYPERTRLTFFPPG